MWNNAREATLRHSRTRLAVAGTVLTIFLVTLAGAWAEARWPNAAGTHIITKPCGPVDPANVLWQLYRVDGVGDAIAVFRGSLEPDEVEDTGWANVWFYANQTGTSGSAFLPPDPTLGLGQGRFPRPHSLDEVILGHELAQALRVDVGGTVTIRHRSFRVVGIWEPSGRLPGNFAQLSALAAEAILPPDDRVPYRFIVIPADRQDATKLARRIWQEMPDLEVVSPQWELANTMRERVVLLLALTGTVILALLLGLPLLGDLARMPDTSPALIALVSGAGGLATAWATTLLINQYAAHTLGLTPFRVTLRLAVVVLATSVGIGLLAAQRFLRRSWSVRWTATALVLALCGTGMATVGSLGESLHVSLGQAQLAAIDWVAISGSPEDSQFLRTIHRLPGIRGYVIQAYGGLAGEDEERWAGPRPVSGVIYGLRYAGGEGTLSSPYPIAYWHGRALNLDNLYEAVIGYDLAQELGLDVGDTIEARGRDLLVVGIRDRLHYESHSDYNHRVDVSLETLRRVLHVSSSPAEITLLIPPAGDQEEKGAFLQEVSRRLRVGRVSTIEDRLAEMARSYPGAWTLALADAQGATRHAKTLYTNMLVLCSMVLLSAGALAVTSTMAVRLTKDDQRVSLSKALGADEGTLFGKYVQKGTVLGIVGGTLGVLGGWAVATTLNQLAASGSTELLFTPRLGAGVFFFIVLTAIAATIGPASLATRRDAGWILYASPTTETVTSGGSEP